MLTAEIVPVMTSSRYEWGEEIEARPGGKIGSGSSRRKVNAARLKYGLTPQLGGFCLFVFFMIDCIKGAEA